MNIQLMVGQVILLLLITVIAAAGQPAAGQYETRSSTMEPLLYFDREQGRDVICVPVPTPPKPEPEGE